MGGINFYRKFVSHFSQLAHLLHQLTNKDNFIWFADAQCHFDKLKKPYALLRSSDFPDLVQPFEIETDASQFAIGTVLK
jgi:hypothetical protein